MMFLMWIKQYPTEYFLAFIFEIDRSTVHRNLQKVIDVFFTHYNQELSFKNYQFRAERGVKYNGKLITIILDGTEQQVFTPSNKIKEQSLYSGKKCKHTFTLLIGVSPDGYILFVSLSYNGSNNDLNLIEFPENHIWKYINTDEYIMADKGFKGMPRGVLPFIGNESPFTEKEKQFNRGLAAIRIVVENAIAHIKKWKICSTPFRCKTYDINEFVMPIRNRL
ncbi:hypothetical protein C9374_001143 [Naegleria lovaniensis]|uniref:DDE Tnp4 domain-containing protein n=1 Tax=Naegleria lovaniensis TaxID=51637 RepID=A0AA88KN28_NAELO|nr:uncharacterized protein C9374_001143 [Naegleria lovaniensis]KAG2387549.1 hypothetical protein C9374_001143 [Naegleria lovaniensis]